MTTAPFSGKAKAIFGLGLACLVLNGLPKDSVAQTASAAGPVTWAMGRADAPVTLIEYGSLTCGHCAEFNNEALPALKRTYIDTGQVRYVFRPFPTPPGDLAIAMHMLTLCAGPTRYYGLVDAFFARQPQIFAAATGETGPKGTLFAIAEDFGGLTYSQAENCLRDTSRQTQVLASSNAGQAAGVRATPTLFVNGTMVSGHEGRDVAAAIENALRARVPARPAPKAKKR